MPSPLLAMPGVVAYWQSGEGLYQDTTATTTATGTDPIGAWVDRIAGLPLIQATGASQPHRVTSTFKGGIGVEFAPGAPNEFLTCAAFDASSGATEGAWVVAMYRPRTDALVGILANTQGAMVISDQSGTLTFDYNVIGAFSFATYRDGCYHGKALIASFDGSQPVPADRVRYRINRTDRVGTWTADPGTAIPAASGLTMGAFANETGGMTGVILEAAYLDHALTQEEIDAIEDYWAETFFAQGQKKAHVLGDSVSLGYPFNTSDGNNWPSRLAVLLGSPWTTQNVSIVSFMIAQMELSGGTIDRDRDEWRDRDVVLLCTGTNDGFQNHTPAQAIADMTTSVENRHEYGFEVWVECLPFAFPAGQGLTDPTLEEYDAFRAEYNAAVRAQAMGHDGVFDLSAEPGFEQPISTSFYNADWTHLDAPGSLYVAGVVADLLVPPPPPPLTPGPAGDGAGIGTRRGARP